jgi:hypothetical protein
VCATFTSSTQLEAAQLVGAGQLLAASHETDFVLTLRVFCGLYFVACLSSMHRPVCCALQCLYLACLL